MTSTNQKPSRQTEDIQKRYADGEITNAQMWEEMKELKRDYRAAAEEAIHESGERERDN